MSSYGLGCGVCLHRLQLALGGDVLTTDRSTIRWSSAIELQVDVQLFEHACDRGEFEEACRLYRGGFLEGFSPGDCPQFDEWAYCRRVVLFGASEGGPACIKFAAECPDRVAGLILFASLAKGSASPDYPHALQAGQYDVWLQQLVPWGGPAGIETFAPSLASDPQARVWWASLLRAVWCA